VRRYAIGHSHSAPPPGAPPQMRPVAVLPTDSFAVLPAEQWNAYSRRASLPTRVGLVLLHTQHTMQCQGSLVLLMLDCDYIRNLSTKTILHLMFTRYKSSSG